MHATEVLGRIAYQGYCDSTGGVSLISGDKLPDFAELKPEIKTAWIAAAQAIIEQRSPGPKEVCEDYKLRTEGAKEESLDYISGAREGLNDILYEFEELQTALHQSNYSWWHNPYTGDKLDRNVGEMLMLMVSELAEAMEGDRKGLKDDKLPHRDMMEVELADAVIRILDFAGAKGYKLIDALLEKWAYNLNRDDHKIENRLAKGGKKY